MRELGIAIAQTSPVPRDVSANIATHLALAERAAAEGAECVVFPELSLTGYELDAAPDLAFSQEDPRLAPLLGCARRAKTSLLVGAPLRLSGRLLLSQLAIRPDGSVGIYTKRRLGTFSESARCDGELPPPEPSVFVPGDLEPRLDLAAGPASLAICADIGDPEHARRAATARAVHYLASMFVIPSELEGDLTRLRGYAVTYGWLVAFANFVGQSGGLAAAGRSAIWGPDGTLLAQLSSAEPGVAMAWKTADGWHGRRLD